MGGSLHQLLYDRGVAKRWSSVFDTIFDAG